MNVVLVLAAAGPIRVGRWTSNVQRSTLIAPRSIPLRPPSRRCVQNVAVSWSCQETIR